MIYSAEVEDCESLDPVTLFLRGQARYALQDGFAASPVFGSIASVTGYSGGSRLSAPRQQRELSTSLARPFHPGGATSTGPKTAI